MVMIMMINVVVGCSSVLDDQDYNQNIVIIKNTIIIMIITMIMILISLTIMIMKSEKVWGRVAVERAARLCLVAIAHR